MTVPADDSTSDYDPLFDEGEFGSDNEPQEEPGRANSGPNTSAESSHSQVLALPKYVGSGPTAPMRSVENVGTIALPVSPPIFAERPCTLSSSAASHIASKKRHRDIDDDDSDRPCSVRVRVAGSSQSSRAGSITSDRHTTRDARGLSILVPRPKHLPSKPSDHGPLSSGIISFLTHDVDFTAAIRSYVYLLANPPESTKSVARSLPTATFGRPKSRKKVPANAADWDIPYPFPDGGAPPGYLETWSLEKAKSLSNSMRSAVRRAATKLELLRLERKGSATTSDMASPTNEISEKASATVPAVMNWIRSAVKNEGIQIEIDVSSLPCRISDILPGSQPPSTRIDEPISGEDIVAAVRDGVVDARNSFQQKTQAQTAGAQMPPGGQIALHAPDSPIAPFDFAAYQTSGNWGDLVAHLNTPGVVSDASALTGNGETADVCPSTDIYLPASQLSFDQLMDPSLLFAHEVNTVLSADALGPGFLSNMSTTADASDQSVVDWLLATLKDPNGFSDTSSPIGTGSGTPSSSNNVLPSLPPSTLHQTAAQFNQTYLTPAAGATPKLSNLITRIKCVPTKQEIMELQRRTTSSALSTEGGPHSFEERTLVVKDVRSRASAVRARLREELAAVERELWALDIEREVLSEVQRSVAGQNQ